MQTLQVAFSWYQSNRWLRFFYTYLRSYWRPFFSENHRYIYWKKHWNQRGSLHLCLSKLHQTWRGHHHGDREASQLYGTSLRRLRPGSGRRGWGVEGLSKPWDVWDWDQTDPWGWILGGGSLWKRKGTLNDPKASKHLDLVRYLKPQILSKRPFTWAGIWKTRVKLRKGVRGSEKGNQTVGSLMYYICHLGWYKSNHGWTKIGWWKRDQTWC